MHKRILVMLFTLVYLLSGNVLTYAQQEAQIVVSDNIANPGSDNVIIKIDLKNNPGIVSAKMTIDFDSEALTLTNVSDGGILGNAYHSPSFENPYNLYWNNGSVINNFTSDGTLVTLTFSVSNNAKESVYPILISYDEDNILNADMDNVFFDTTDGSIRVETIEVENKPAISIGEISIAENSFDVTLNADNYTGIVIAALYSIDGTLNTIKFYPASENISVVFDKWQTGDYVKVMWWDSFTSIKPLCNSKIINIIE